MDVLHLEISNNTIININSKQDIEYNISTTRSILSIPHIHTYFIFYIPFSLYRAQTLEVLLSPYYSKKKRFLIYPVNEVCHQLGPICLTSLHMDSFELWMVGNVLSQSIKKCYYLIDNLWCFVVNTCYHVCISTHPACIFNSCIALNKILCFIKGQLCSIGHEDIDCPHCLLTLKHQLVFYLKLF